MRQTNGAYTVTQTKYKSGSVWPRGGLIGQRLLSLLALRGFECGLFGTLPLLFLPLTLLRLLGLALGLCFALLNAR